MSWLRLMINKCRCAKFENSDFRRFVRQNCVIWGNRGQYIKRFLVGLLICFDYFAWELL